MLFINLSNGFCRLNLTFLLLTIQSLYSLYTKVYTYPSYKFICGRCFVLYIFIVKKSDFRSKIFISSSENFFIFDKLELNTPKFHTELYNSFTKNRKLVYKKQIPANQKSQIIIREHSIKIFSSVVSSEPCPKYR